MVRSVNPVVAMSRNTMVVEGSHTPKKQDAVLERSMQQAKQLVAKSDPKPVVTTNTTYKIGSNTITGVYNANTNSTKLTCEGPLGRNQFRITMSDNLLVDWLPQMNNNSLTVTGKVKNVKALVQKKPLGY
jgi:hypothetical protein